MVARVRRVVPRPFVVLLGAGLRREGQWTEGVHAEGGRLCAVRDALWYKPMRWKEALSLWLCMGRVRWQGSGRVPVSGADG